MADGPREPRGQQWERRGLLDLEGVDGLVADRKRRKIEQAGKGQGGQKGESDMLLSVLHSPFFGNYSIKFHKLIK